MESYDESPFGLNSTIASTAWAKAGMMIVTMASRDSSSCPWAWNSSSAAFRGSWETGEVIFQQGFRASAQRHYDTHFQLDCVESQFSRALPKSLASICSSSYFHWRKRIQRIDGGRTENCKRREETKVSFANETEPQSLLGFFVTWMISMLPWFWFMAFANWRNEIHRAGAEHHHTAGETCWERKREKALKRSKGYNIQSSVRWTVSEFYSYYTHLSLHTAFSSDFQRPPWTSY